MTNGFILLTPVRISELPEGMKPKEYLSSNIITLPNNVKDKLSDTYGKVAFIGNCNREYVTGEGDWEGLNVGDLVAFKKHFNQVLEYPLHASFRGKEIFYYLQRRYIMWNFGKLI